MSKTILGFTMSLDGYVNDKKGSVKRLYPDLAALKESESLKEQIRNTGAVIMGYNTYMMASPKGYEGYEFQVPIFVLTDNLAAKKLPGENKKMTFTFITDGIEIALERAKKAAGHKDVTIIGGASVAEQYIRAGLVDELHVDIMPVIFNGGLRIFDHLGHNFIELKKIKTIDSADKVEIRYKILPNS